MVATVDYDDATHTYKVDGVIYPSVTEVLNHLVSFDRVPRDVLERKRQIGRATHKAIELYEKHELDADTIDEAIEPYLFSWIRFAAVMNPKVIAAERIVYSTKHRVAGRLDLIVEFPGDENLWCIDAKCVSQVSAVTALQTAAYSELWNERETPKVKKRAALQLQHDGAIAKMVPYDKPENRNDFGVFMNAAMLNRWIANNRR